MSHNIVVPGGTTVRLPTAGKYCDRDIVVTAEGGGIELDVVTASSLPSAVVDGQIVVITDTVAGTVCIDTDEPVSPAAGDVWVKLEAGSDVGLDLTEENPFVGAGLNSAMVWNGAKWDNKDAYIGKAGTWEQFSNSLPPIGTSLNDMSWEDISKVAKAGRAADYFSVGDSKSIILQGTLGYISLNAHPMAAFIIGIDHNATLEGKNKIHFQLGFDSPTTRKPFCLSDMSYWSGTRSDPLYFIMNTTASNVGGWASSSMRNRLLGNSGTPTNPPASSYLSILPEDLRAVIKPIKKYTDNVGGATNVESNVTMTEDYIWLLSAFEVFGVTNKDNTYEKNYQKQYAYYGAGNSKKFYSQLMTTTVIKWWLRSVNASNNKAFNMVNNSGAYDAGPDANNSFAIAACFCV